MELEGRAHSGRPVASAWVHAVWFVGGSLLMLFGLGLTRLSHGFRYDSAMRLRPIPQAVMLLIGAGLLYLVMVRHWASVRSTAPLLTWMILAGLVCRCAVFFSTPILEDDFYRYLWDGGVAAHGIDPFKYAPRDVADRKEGVPRRLLELADESGNVIRRVNHPQYRTIYPPVAQAAFALAHWLDPWDLNGWRAIVLGLDVLTLFLICRLLRLCRLPVFLAVVYWWNPTVIKELYNSAHMDIIVFPFVLSAVLFALRGRYVPASAFLALAAGAKLWPVVLLPVLLRPLLRQPRRLAPAAAAFCLPLIALMAPVLLGRLNESSGFVAYGRAWEMNDALFMAILWGFQWIAGVGGLAAGHAEWMTRLSVGVMLIVWMAFLLRRPITGPIDACRRCLWVVAAVFLLSPTQFPWYFVWVVPFLAVHPSPGLLLLSALLPFYYMRFYYRAWDNVGLFDNQLVWIEYVPVWALLIWEAVRRRRPLPDVSA